jgi:protein TonB
MQTFPSLHLRSSAFGFPRASRSICLIKESRVEPHYPEEAQQAGIQGQVLLKAEISKDGAIQNLQLISGNPKLAQAAIEAVKKWKYKPYLLNRQPVALETQIEVDFQLRR